MWISRASWTALQVLLRRQRTAIYELRDEGEELRMVMDDLRMAVERLIADFAAHKAGMQASIDAAVAANQADNDAKAQALLDTVNTANPPSA